MSKYGSKNDAEIVMPLKHLSKFWRILTTNMISKLLSNQRARTFAMTETELYVTVVALSTLDNTQLLEQLISGFKRTIN